MQETQHQFDETRANRVMEASESNGGSRRFSTKQWVSYDVYDAFKRAARARPDFTAEIGRISEADGMVNVNLTFTVPGKILFVRQLTNFIFIAMRDFYIRSV